MTPRRAGTRHSPRILIAALAAFAARAHAQPTESAWQAAAGLRPDQVCPAWTLVDTAPGADPVLGNGKLVLATAAPAQDMYYVQTTELESPLPDPIVVEAEVQFTSGTSNLNNRGPVAVAITTAPNTGALFFVSDGEIFVTATGDVRGQRVAVDTASAPHTYHIEVTAAGAVSVRYDGTPMLTGTTYTSAPAFGDVPRILWGEGSIVAFGTESWFAFRHNAAVCPSGTTTTSVSTTSTVTSASSTVTSASSTTTSTLPAGCDGAPGSLATVICRLDALGTDIAGDSIALGGIGSKLGHTLARATALAQQGDDACGSNDSKKASRRMKQTQKQLQNMAHRLRGLAARKRIDATVRSGLIATIQGIQSDVAALRSSPCS